MRYGEAHAAAPKRRIEAACRAVLAAASSSGSHLLRRGSPARVSDQTSARTECEPSLCARPLVARHRRGDVRSTGVVSAAAKAVQAHLRTEVIALCRGPFRPATIVTTKLGRSRAQLYASAACAVNTYDNRQLSQATEPVPCLETDLLPTDRQVKLFSGNETHRPEAEDCCGAGFADETKDLGSRTDRANRARRAKER